MNTQLESIVLTATGATALIACEPVQSLWSGYGKIVRCTVRYAHGRSGSVVVKHVSVPHDTDHPRGWNTDRSHERKVQSYRIESNWYEHWAARCDSGCRVPACLHVEAGNNELFLVLEDLDASGFHLRPERASERQIDACLTWLAHFHATFVHEDPVGLWRTGTYWHLATRPDELAKLDDEDLKAAARDIDQALTGSPYQTLVHGDAKLANFCFAPDGNVAAVDFQYVGGGCGIKDVAYFISSCLDEAQCEQLETQLLDTYFESLKRALGTQGKNVDAARIETDWRRLYPYAWTDFFRFLQGWSPGHWKIHRYSRRIAREVLRQR